MRESMQERMHRGVVEPCVPQWSLRTIGLLLVGSLLTTLTIACASTATTPSAEGSVVTRQNATSLILPVLSDDVAVIPFQSVRGFILVQTEVNGRHGIFVLDTGCPLVVLNREYVMAKAGGGLDTVTGAQHTGYENGNAETATVQTLHAGSFPMTEVHDAMVAKVPGLVLAGTPILGILGVSALLPYETILDYRHQRLILIPLNTAGQRITPVAAYEPAATVAMVKSGKETDQDFWIQANVGDSPVLLDLDTGSPRNDLDRATWKRLGTHLTPAGRDTAFAPLVQGTTFTLDHMVVGGVAYDTLPFLMRDTTSFGFWDANILGDPFFRAHGTVGFNFRTQRLILYK